MMKSDHFFQIISILKKVAENEKDHSDYRKVVLKSYKMGINDSIVEVTNLKKMMRYEKDFIVGKVFVLYSTIIMQLTLLKQYTCQNIKKYMANVRKIPWISLLGDTVEPRTFHNKF